MALAMLVTFELIFQLFVDINQIHNENNEKCNLYATSGSVCQGAVIIFVVSRWGVASFPFFKDSQSTVNISIKASRVLFWNLLSYFLSFLSYVYVCACNVFITNMPMGKRGVKAETPSCGSSKKKKEKRKLLFHHNIMCTLIHHAQF